MVIARFSVLLVLSVALQWLKLHVSLAIGVIDAGDRYNGEILKEDTL